MSFTAQQARRAVLAMQFLTRLPTPQVTDFNPEDLSRASAWFPAVGLLIGVLLAAVLTGGTFAEPWAGAALALAFWVWVTGGLHLDGLGDLADARGAAHRDPARFHAVMKDPHIGTFGVLALIVQLAIKLVFLMLLAEAGEFWALIVICAAARLGPLYWSAFLPVLKPPGEGDAGSGERFSWAVERGAMIFWSVALLAAAFLQPALLLAPLGLFVWWGYLNYVIGGQTGDCLGAGIEFAESFALAGIVLVLLIQGGGL